MMGKGLNLGFKFLVVPTKQDALTIKDHDHILKTTLKNFQVSISRDIG